MSAGQENTEPNAMTDLPDQDEGLLSLQRAYLRDCLERTDGVTTLFVEDGPNPTASGWETCRKFAHNLKGTGGSYGFVSLSNMARTLENSAREQTDSSRVTKHLNELRAEIEALIRATGTAGSPEGSES